MKKVMIWYGLIFLLLISCQSPNNANNENEADSISSVISYVATKDAKGLFASAQSIPSNNIKGHLKDTTAGAIAVTSALSYVSSSGNIQPVIFTTADNGNAILNITKIKQLTNTIIAFCFNEVITVSVTIQEGSVTYSATSITSVEKTAIADISSGSFFDVTGYNIISNSVVYSGFLYTTNGSGTVYKIDLSSITSAVPLTIGSYLNAGTLLFVTKNGKLITSTCSIDINGVIPPKTISKSASLTQNVSLSAEFQGLSINATPVPVVIDADGSIWCYDVSWFFTASGTPSYCTYQISIDDAGNTSISDYSEKLLSISSAYGYGVGNFQALHYFDKSRIHLNKDSFVTVAVQPTGGISLQDASISLPFSSVFYNTSSGSVNSASGGGFAYNNSWGQLYCYNNTLYWMVGTTIYSAPLSSGGSGSPLYSDGNIVNPVSGYDRNGNVLPSLLLTDGNLLFYEYQTPTIIGTYRLPVGQATPSLISTCQENACNIVQLTF